MTFPLIPHPAWDILDSSKLDDFIGCPRYYFFAHILGWRVDQPAQDLWFGDCWHVGREYQMVNGYVEISGAFKAFLTKYRTKFPQSTDDIYIPKTPLAAMTGYVKYAEEFQHELMDFEVVTDSDGRKLTEISGTVPISDNRVLHYKMDSIVRQLSTGRIQSWDHKHTSFKWWQNPKWDNEYYLSLQNGTYTHCLYCLFPINLVDGVSFRKIGFEYLKRGSANRDPGFYAHIRNIDAFKNPDQMDVWLNNTLMIVEELDREMDHLHHCTEGDSVMLAFRQNPKHCTAYRGCQFHDFCLSWKNPLQRCYQPELGFKVEFWDPRERVTTVHKDLEMWSR